MSNESFDKKMKEELEGISRPVQSDVWAKIQPNLPLPWYMVAWTKYAWPFYAFTTTCLLFVGGYKQNQLDNQLKNAYEKIITLESVLTSLSSTETAGSKDTVYIEKTIYVTCNHDNLLSEQPNSFASKQNKSHFSHQENTNSQEKSSVRASSFPPISTHKENKASGLLTNVDKTTIVKEKQNILPGSQSIEIDSVVSRSELENTFLEEQNVETVAESDEKEEVDLMNTVETQADTAQIPLKMAENKVPKKTFTWPKIQTRIGMTGHYNLPETFGLGSVFELFLSKNMSISGGIIGKKYPEVEFENASVYNFTLGERFETKFEEFIPKPYDRLEDIELNTSVIQVPIHFNYYQPLNRSFSLLYSFGTHTDARVFQHIDFETYLNEEETYTDFTISYRPKSFSTFSMGAGLQYQWSQIRFQLQPSFLYRFREADYYSTGGRFQVRAGILFQLSN